MIIREKDKLSLQQLAKQHISTPCEIIAYGSRVDGTAHDTSDLDLVILCKDDKKLDIGEFMAFKDAVQNSTIPILVQIFDWGRMPEYFKDGILECYEVLIKI
jgi:predicted nucleotidyltransferase